MGPIAAVIGAVASVGGTIASTRQAKKAAGFQSQQIALQQQQQELATRRSQRQAIREAQILRARTQSSAQAMGVVGSSAASGATASVGSQLGGTTGFASQMGGISGQISGLSQQIGMAQTQGSIFQGIAGLGAGLFSAADGFDAFGKKNNVDLTAGVK